MNIIIFGIQLNQFPNTVVINSNTNLSALVNANTASVENSRRSNGVSQGRQTFCIQISRLGLAVVDGSAAINELLNRDVAITSLSVEVAVLIGGITHVEGVEPGNLPSRVVGNVVTTVSLVNADLTVGSKVVEVLVCVDTSALRSSPGGGVDANGALGGIILLSPGDEHGDGVFGLLDAAAGDSDALGGRSGHFDGDVAVLDHGVADVDVVAVEVVGDIGLLACPGLEGVELVLGLRHVRVPVVKIAEVLGLEARIGVRGVEALVVLNEDVHALLLGLAN